MGYSLLCGTEGVEFDVWDKPRSIADYWRFYRAFRRRRFDAVLAMQASLRCNLLYPALRAPVKVGFDRVRAKDGQWLFCNQRIEFRDEHLVDSFMAFTHRLRAGDEDVEWHLPIEAADHEFAQREIGHLRRPIVAIHPCSSKAERNWPLERFVEVMAAARSRWNCSFVFTGGAVEAERAACARLAEQAGASFRNLCGMTTPKQFTAVLSRVDAVIAPDTAAVHLARAVETPAVGLYAVAPPVLSGPYGGREFIVDRYPEAVRRYLRRDPEGIGWNTKVHHPQCMRLITPEDVMQKLSLVIPGRVNVRIEPAAAGVEPFPLPAAAAAGFR